MQRWTQAQFEQLAAGATTLAADEHGVKVLLTPDDRIIKLFRRKRWLSSTLVFPYARRFERASTELAKRGIPAVRVEAVARVPHLRRDVVVYRRLPGVTLRDALADARDDHNGLLNDLAALLAGLHEHGVYFRAAHFGNILVRASDADGLGRLALIDISEARFRRGSLSPALRARNFRPLTSYDEDRAALRAFGIPRFISGYLEHACLSARDAARFREALNRVHPEFARE